MSDQSTLRTFYYLKFWTKLSLLLLFALPVQAGEWAENCLNQMTLHEKICHLFMIPVITRSSDQNVDQVEAFIKEYPVGSLLMMYGSIPQQITAVNRLQKTSELPLLIGQDNEWGLDLRLTESLRFPRNLTLGALSNPDLVYELGREVALQCQGVGVHINFAPVIDINNNPSNPVISDRSFGETAEIVTQNGLAYMKGLQDQGVLSCAKHFPGHGDTHIDSHFSLPTIAKTKEELMELEWKPFQALIQEGLQSMMTAHLMFPLLAETYPSSLSQNLIQNSLKGELGFKGLVITDSLDMKAISNHFEGASSDLLALTAGNDIVIQFTQLEKRIERIKQGVQENEITEREIDEKVLKILETKERLLLHKNRFLSSDTDLFSKKALQLKKSLFREAITLIQNKDALPLHSTPTIAFVQIGRDVIMKNALELVHSSYEEQCPDEAPPFYQALQQDLPVDFFFLPKKADPKDLARIEQKLASYQSVVIGIYEMNKFEHLNYGLQESTFLFLKNLRANKKQIYLSLFGSPYSLKYFTQEDVILMCYENDEDAQIGAAEILMGKRSAKGRLPISASEQYPFQYGIIQNSRAFLF